MALDAVLNEVLEVKRLAPLATYGALGFYFFLFLLVVPQIRRGFVSLFTPAAPATQTLIKPLDSLRGMAALGIASFHMYTSLRSFYGGVAAAPLLQQAYKAVPIFVVLSGFLIYRSLRDFEELDDLRTYVRRRVFRIYPLYVASVLVFFALADVRPAPYSWFQRVLPEIFMMKIFGYPTYIYPSYWSLYVEELFYIAMPLWVVSTKRWPLLSAYGGLALFTLVGSVVPDDLAVMKYFFIGIIACELLESKDIRKATQLGAGALVAVGLLLLYLDFTSGDILGKYIAHVARGFGATLVFDRAYNPADPYQHYYTFTLGVGFGLFLLGAIKFRPINYLLSLFPLRFLGTISYSLFIWHGFIMLDRTNLYLNTMMPMMVPTDALALATNMKGTWISFLGIYFPAFIFAASISYLAIERPFLLMRRRGKQKTATPSTSAKKRSLRNADVGLSVH